MNELHEGGGGMIPTNVLAAHAGRGQFGYADALGRLLNIDAEILAAAKAGNTARVRELRAEKQNLENVHAGEREAMLATLAARKAPKHDALAKGEEQRLAKQAKRLNAEVLKKQAEREKLLAQLADDPGNEPILDKLAGTDRALAELAAEVQEVAGRRERVERWRDERRREKAADAEKRRKAREAPKVRARLDTAVTVALSAYRQLEITLPQITAMLDALGDVRTASQTYEKIRAATGAGLRFDAVGWRIEKTWRR